MLTRLCFLLLLSLAYGNNDGEDDWATTTTTPDVTETSTVEDIEPFVNNLMNDAFKNGLPVFTKFGSDTNVSTDCSAALIKTMLALRRMEHWAFQMADSNGRPAAGMLKGTVADLGNYDECLAVVVKDSYGDVDFTGKYCNLFINPKGVPYVNKIVKSFQSKGELTGPYSPLRWLNQDLFFGMQVGVCIPSKCSGRELLYMADTLLSRYGMSTLLRGCETQDKGPFTQFQKCMLIFLAVLSGILCLSTLYDAILHYLPEKRKCCPKLLNQILVSFSVLSNTRKLISTEAEKESDSIKLRFIHGMRFFSSSWVILGHTYLLVSVTVLADSLNIVKFHDDPAFLMIANAYPCIQSFLFISGFLVAYNVLKYLKDYKGNYAVPIALLLVRRYIRLTAPVMFLVGIWLLLPAFTWGPLYTEYKDVLFGMCEKNWWRVLLHVNNWVPFFDMCLGHLWYISVDWQIYAVLWFIPFVMLKRKKLGFFFLFLVILGTTVLVALQTKLNHFQPTAIYIDPNINQTFEAGNQIYFKPFAHAGAFCIGIATAYAVLIYGAAKINRPMQAALWALAAVIGFSVVFGPYKWYRGADYDTVDAVLYASTHRTAWAVSLGWVTFACATGRGGPINAFLSWQGFVPFSRLSFSAFLMQTVVILMRCLVTRERLHYSHTYMVQDYFFAFMMTYITAYLLFLVFEAPVGNLEKIIFMGNRGSFADAAAKAKVPQEHHHTTMPVEVVMMAPNKTTYSSNGYPSYEEERTSASSRSRL
ncbi:nose resistant to fluoxetine protein 6-like [Ornithodoros turicata]|uniref:nose resistant to fluoxetine protein 6-like n=1 Tax=Ornithodoros turicata TaxID=34597 RepID=UPI0031388F97